MMIELPEVEYGKNVFEVKINLSDLIIDKNEIGQTLGYSNGTTPEHFTEMLDGVLAQLPERCEIRAGYRIVDIKKPSDRKDGLLAENIFFRVQKIVAGQVKKAETAAFFVCTIGPKMETWARQEMRDGDPTLSFFIDTIASVTVESVTDLLHDHIEQKMQMRGLKITNRYSPGYCDWFVAEQHLLFSLFPKNFCGISLTDSALMVPIKSVSGIIGIGKEVKRVDYFCDTCGMKDCTYRASRLARAERNARNVKS